MRKDPSKPPEPWSIFNTELFKNHVEPLVRDPEVNRIITSSKEAVERNQQTLASAQETLKAYDAYKRQGQGLTESNPKMDPSMAPLSSDLILNRPLNPQSSALNVDQLKNLTSQQLTQSPSHQIDLKMAAPSRDLIPALPNSIGYQALMRSDPFPRPPHAHPSKDLDR